MKDYKNKRIIDDLMKGSGRRFNGTHKERDNTVSEFFYCCGLVIMGLAFGVMFYLGA